MNPKATTVPTIKVIHPDGIAFVTLRRAERAIESGAAIWRDRAKTTIRIISREEDQPNSDYEYGGKKSYNRRACVQCCDLRTHSVIDIPVEHKDRTGIPVREPGGAKVLQLKELTDRRTSGMHTPNHDKLYRPGLRRTSAYDDNGMPRTQQSK